MLQIGDTLISLDIIDKKFICNVPKCLGKCCEHGDSGAPLEESEALIIKKEYPSIKPHLSEAGIKNIEEIGTFTIDIEGDLVTTLINKKECSFTVYEKGIATCGIERAWENGDCSLQKPISCHLYPIRLKKYPTFIAVNYDQWDVCQPALMLGQKENLPLYKFLKTPLIRRFGEEWYGELALAAHNLEQEGAEF